MDTIHIFVLTILFVKKGGDCRNWKFVEIDYAAKGFMDQLRSGYFVNTWSAKSTYELSELRQIYNMLNITKVEEVMDVRDNVLDLNLMTEHPDGMCLCPRVHLSVCASNGITYSNACVMHCTKLNVTVRREGPCLEYRRMNNVLAYNMTLPERWFLPNTTSDKLIELTLLNIDFEDTEDTLKNMTLRRIRISQALVDFFDKTLLGDVNLKLNVLNKSRQLLK